MRLSQELRVEPGSGPEGVESRLSPGLSLWGPRSRLGSSPTACPTYKRPVCGCDGPDLRGTAKAVNAGVMVVHQGPCPVNGLEIRFCDRRWLLRRQHGGERWYWFPARLESR